MHLEISNEETRSKLVELSEWASHAKLFKPHPTDHNIWQCVDEGQYKPALALLEEPDFKRKGHGYSIWRATGQITLKPTERDYQSFWFPLSREVQVAGEAYTLGSYLLFTSPFTFNGPLDYLIVYLPNNGQSSAVGKLAEAKIEGTE